jgi:glutamine amidotransferase
MCRLVAIVSSEPTGFRFALNDAPRSLAALSHEHPDGWGLAVWDGDWVLKKEAACARSDARFSELSAEVRGEVLVGHIRKRTRGAIEVKDTHPFTRDGWVFAHNGTVHAEPWLRERTARLRLEQIEGATDSELFFAYLLTAMDAAAGDLDGALGAAVRELEGRADAGACNFVLSNGRTTYVHRFGRTLALLRREQGDPLRRSRTSQETLATLETPWTERRLAILVASERMTEEPWEDLPEGTLLRIDRGGPRVTWLTPRAPHGRPQDLPLP